MNKTIRELKSKQSIYCIYGRCSKCSRIVDGRGIHDVATYEIYKYKSDIDCPTCDGDGEIEDECPHCDGTGDINRRCEQCNGQKRIVDECGEREFVKEDVVLE